MITNTIDCDRCGSRIETDRHPLQITAGQFRTAEPYDLCGRCVSAFLEWLDAPRAKAKANAEPRGIETMRDVLTRTAEGAVLA